ncbi:hypothetical protein BDP27DRAFT_1310536 [Rhodocollybia butyracea]|uniref:Smr domain-containing protein n=1 Tax=Rhodocollybia butyracea TaxID=206335 RepID=A0A9P5Q400_9AGAR|nr:hypothetical protein BDP27DRAFT_1310536 [Rhodocollybia butyracea]
MNTQANLFDKFQVQFCPPLDSSLLAAILLDVDPDSEPTKEQIDVIEATLSELAAQADVLQTAEDYSDFAVADDRLSTPSFTRGETAVSNSSSELQPFDTPLGFLQAAFPDIQSQKLQCALVDAELGDSDLDMWDIVAGLLTEELIRELEERGLDGTKGYDTKKEDSWEIAGKKERYKNKRRRQKVTLVDLRQQQHAKPPESSSESSSRLLAPDPWTQISSLSTHLASLLPSHEPSFFSSFFHSPKYPTPYLALVEALREIAKTRASEEDYAPILISLLDILLLTYDDHEQKSHLVSVAELALTATEGRPEDALDLVRLLHDLNEDSSGGNFEMGIYHEPMPHPHPTDASRPGRAPARRSQLPSGPPPVPPPPLLKGNSSMACSENKPSPYRWQSVPQRKTRKTTHPLAQYIPTYNRDVNGIRVRDESDVGELEFRKRIKDSRRKRDEMLREASRMWQKGNAKTRGGEVALYFAHRAREYQEVAKKDALDAARMMVESKRISSGNPDTIDMHGITASEAIVIVSETLASMACSSSNPLRIITGRGTHSTNRIGVLKPTLQKWLVEDGWTVSTWDGGLIVRGKR